MRTVLLSILSGWAAFSPVLGAETPAPADPFADPLIKNVMEMHAKAENGGDKKQTLDLIEFLEKATSEHPNNQLLRCYLGSAYTLRSRDIGFGPSALKYLKEGLKMMDAAVTAAPDNASVRFIRGTNNYMLPAFVNRRDNARADFKWLVDHIDKETTGFNAETRQAIYYYAGLAFKQTRDYALARTAWTKGRTVVRNGPLNEKIDAELAKLKDKGAGGAG
jgi:hypothetical protein